MNYGEWSVVREIGEGSFGKVYEIVREEYGYTYHAALKVITIPQVKSEIDQIRSQGMSDADVTEYYQSIVEECVQEIALMSQMQGHTNIVNYQNHEVRKHKEGLGWDILIQMELLTPLSKYIANNPLTQREIIDIGISVCNALERCQKFNIIHRDIKPDNIFISEHGDFKLGDFGIARTAEHTMSGMSRKGTYAYMAPEIYQGKAYSHSVDIYSLGMVLYRLLNNNRGPFMPPYPERIRYQDQEHALIRRMSGEELPLPKDNCGRLAEIVLKACSYEPKDRYSNPKQMRQDLEIIRYNELEQQAFLKANNRGAIQTIATTPNNLKQDIQGTGTTDQSMNPVFVEEGENVACGEAKKELAAKPGLSFQDMASVQKQIPPNEATINLFSWPQQERYESTVEELDTEKPTMELIQEAMSREVTPKVTDGEQVEEQEKSDLKRKRKKYCTLAVVTAVVAVVLLVLGIGLFGGREAETEKKVPSITVYKNSSYGYSLSVPDSMPNYVAPDYGYLEKNNFAGLHYHIEQKDGTLSGRLFRIKVSEQGGEGAIIYNDGKQIYTLCQSFYLWPTEDVESAWGKGTKWKQQDWDDVYQALCGTIFTAPDGTEVKLGDVIAKKNDSGYYESPSTSFSVVLPDALKKEVMIWDNYSYNDGGYVEKVVLWLPYIWTDGESSGGGTELMTFCYYWESEDAVNQDNLRQMGEHEFMYSNCDPLIEERGKALERDCLDRDKRSRIEDPQEQWEFFRKNVDDIVITFSDGTEHSMEELLEAYSSENYYRKHEGL